MNKNFKMCAMAFALIASLFCNACMTSVAAQASDKITINKKSITLYIGETSTLKVKGTSKTPVWSSSKKSVVTVSSTGKISAKKSGKANITAKVDSNKLTCQVVVKKPTLNKTKLSLEKGKTFTLKLKGPKVVKWSSNDTLVATVNSKGKVTALNKGKATITAVTKNNKKYKCVVNVTHEHKYKLKYEKEATCTEDGYQLYVCSCGANYTEIIKAEGHDYCDEEIKEATCTEKGLIRYTCNFCDATYDEVVPALGHKYDEGEVSREATCERKGIVIYTCENCGKHKIEYIPALGHSFTDYEIIKEPTCEEEGLKEHTCENCLETFEETIPPLGHKFEFVEKVEPTCEEEGYSLYRCTVCGEEEERDIQEPLGHAFDEGVVTEQPTCEEEGEKTFTCTRCGFEKTEAIPALGHDFKSTIVAPSCEGDGFTLHECTRCSVVERDNFVPALGHDLDDGVVIKEATCVECGTRLCTCKRCGAEIEEEIPKNDHHKYKITKVEPTFDHSGYEEGVCALCGDTYKDYKERPLILEEWTYQVYEDKKIINLLQYKGDDIEIEVPGTIHLGNTEYQTTIGYDSNDVEKIFINCRGTVKHIALDGVQLCNGRYLFNNCSSLEAVEFSDVSCSDDCTFEAMFLNCDSLDSIDLSGIDMSNVYSMYRMFDDCESLSTIWFPSVECDASNIGYTFRNCVNLSQLVLNDFTLSNVSSAGGTFQNCSKLTNTDFNFIYGNNGATTNGMFDGCKSITGEMKLENISFNGSNISSNSATNMFRDCTGVTSIKVNEIMLGQLQKFGTEKILVNTSATLSVE